MSDLPFRREWKFIKELPEGYDYRFFKMNDELIVVGASGQDCFVCRVENDKLIPQMVKKET